MMMMMMIEEEEGRERQWCRGERRRWDTPELSLISLISPHCTGKLGVRGKEREREKKKREREEMR